MLSALCVALLLVAPGSAALAQDPTVPPGTLPPGTLPPETLQHATETIAPIELPPLEPIASVEVGGGAPLVLDEVLRSVELHHPTLEAQRSRAQAADAAVMSAEGGFDPTLRASAAVYPEGYYRYGVADASITQATPLWGTQLEAGWRIGRDFDGAGIPDYYGERETLDGGELRLGIRVPLLAGGPIDATRATIWRAEHGRDAAEASVDASRLSLGLEAARAYQRWLAAGVKLRIAQELLRLAEERDDQIRRRVVAGAIAPIEQLENRRAILERRMGLVAATRAMEQAAIQLSFYLRDEDGSPRVVDPSRAPDAPRIPPSPTQTEDESIARALERRPELTRFRALLAAADVSIEEAENQILPRLDLLLGGSIDVGGGAGGPSDQSRLGSPVFTGGVQLTIPIPMRSARGRTEQRRAERTALLAEAQLASDRVGVEVRDAISALRAAEQRAALAEANAEIAERVARAERIRFESGATTLLIVNIREATAASARASLADALAELAVAHAYYQAATGGPGE